MAERWKPVTGKVYRIGDRLLRLLCVRRGEPTFEIEVHPLPIDPSEKPRVEETLEGTMHELRRPQDVRSSE